VVSELRLGDSHVVQRAAELRAVVVQTATNRDLPAALLERALPFLLLGVEAAERPMALGGCAAVRAEEPFPDRESLPGELLGLGIIALVDESPRELVQGSGGLPALPPVALLPDRQRLAQELLRLIRLSLDLQDGTE